MLLELQPPIRTTTISKSSTFFRWRPCSTTNCLITNLRLICSEEPAIVTKYVALQLHLKNGLKSIYLSMAITPTMEHGELYSSSIDKRASHREGKTTYTEEGVSNWPNTALQATEQSLH